MKTAKNIICAVICSLLFVGCDKIEFFNLKRDNSLDEKNNVNMQDGILLKFDDYSVYSDNNYNDIINKGETVKLNVSLKNTGSNIARSVKATFSTTSTYISGLSPNTPINYGDIFSGSTVWKDGSYYYYDGYAIQFTVSNSIPNNTQIPINISIVDKNSHTWLSDFNVTVE